MDWLFLPATPSGPLTAQTLVRWVSGEAASSEINLADYAAQTVGPLALVIPVECCSFFAVQLPTRKARWVMQATAYAVEELLAENVEHLHLALGDALSDGRNRVAVIRRSQLVDWLAQLAELGIQPSAIYVDADLLPALDTQVLLFATRGLLGGVGEARLAFAPDSWPQLAQHCSMPCHAWGVLPNAPEAVADYQPLTDPYRLLATAQAASINLAQGEFAIRQAHHGIGRWKKVLTLVGLFLLIQLGFTLGQSWYLRQQADYYAAASLALYQQLFPEDQRIVNLRAQFDQHLSGAAQPSADLLRQLELTAGIILEGTPVMLQQLDYSRQNGGLAMQVSAPDFAALESFRRRLSESGETVELGSANRDGSVITARVVLGG